MATAPLTADEYEALPDVLTADQVAKILNSSPVQVRRWAEQETIPATRIGRRWRFSKTRIEQFVAEGS